MWSRMLHVTRTWCPAAHSVLEFCFERDSERNGPRGGGAKSTGQLWDNYGTTMEQLYGTTSAQPISNGKCMKYDNLKVKNVVLLGKDTCS